MVDADAYGNPSASRTSSGPVVYSSSGHVSIYRSMTVPDHAESNRVFVQDPEIDLSRAPLDTMPAGSFQSSNVHSGLYDFGERQLFMRYLRDGPDAIYQYWEVPAQVWSGLVEAQSKGSYVNANIATDYRYALYGRDDFPDRSQIQNDLLRRFVYDP